jgi:hypothetical protein
MDSIQNIEILTVRDFTNADEFMNARASVLSSLSICRHSAGIDPDEVERVSTLVAGFDFVHEHLLRIVRGMIDSARIITENARALTPPGEAQAITTTPFGTTVYISDWNGFASLFDADFEYTDVTPVVRDVLLALTHSRTVPFGTTLELRFDFTTGRFFCPNLDVDVFVRPWTAFVVTRPRARGYTRTGTAAFQTLVREQNAVLNPDGTFTLDREVGDALRAAYVPPARTPTRNLAVPVRSRPSKRALE